MMVYTVIGGSYAADTRVVYLRNVENERKQSTLQDVHLLVLEGMMQRQKKLMGCITTSHNEQTSCVPGNVDFPPAFGFVLWCRRPCCRR